MNLHFLGTAGYHPNEYRHTSCLMIPEAGLVFDAGTGFFRVRNLLQTPHLNIFLTHAHLDHCVGLSYFIDVVHKKNIEAIKVFGEASKLSAIKRNLFSEHLFPLNPPFEWTVIDDAKVDVPLGGHLSSFSLAHPGGSLGFRVDWPEKSLAYVTDTTARLDAEYVSEIAGVDILVHECHFADGQEELAEKTGHSCLSSVAKVAKAANVGLLVLTHINPMSSADFDLSGAKEIFDQTIVAEDQMQIEF